MALLEWLFTADKKPVRPGGLAERIPHKASKQSVLAANFLASHPYVKWG